MALSRFGPAILFHGAAVILLLAAIAVGINTLGFLRRSLVAPGRVERLNAGGHHPQIAFTTARGEHISFPQGGLVSGWRTGDAVQVRYLPDRPARASIDRFGAIWTWPLFLLLLAAIMAYAGYSAAAS